MPRPIVWLKLAWMTLAPVVLLAAEPQINEPSVSAKRVEIDKTQQKLRAYDGDRLVLESRVSTGRRGKQTPNGSFRVGTKLRVHHSRLYDNAPMPFSVQVNGNYFIHGFESVPDRPGLSRMHPAPNDGQ